MQLVSLHDKDVIEAFLRKHTNLHLYALGDLDDFFWQNTVWYALQDGQQILELVLLYTALELPTLLAITDNFPLMLELLHKAKPLLPSRFYAHLSGNLTSVFANGYSVESHGPHYKMALINTAFLKTVDTTEVIPLTMLDLKDLQELYRVSYPGNWFDPRMLETNLYYGIRRDGRIVSVAGVHVYSLYYKVGVLGNVTTHPGYRGKGLSTAVCAKLCQELLKTVEYIGLNVRSHNRSAIACYKHLGFEIVGEYEEGLVEFRRLSY